MWFQYTSPSAGLFTIRTVANTVDPVVFSLIMDTGNHTLGLQRLIQTGYRVPYNPSDASQTGGVSVRCRLLLRARALCANGIVLQQQTVSGQV